MRIRSHIILMAAGIVLPLSIAGAIALERILQGQREVALQGLSETVRATALIIDGEFHASLTALKVLGHSQNLETGDMLAFYQQAVDIDEKPNVWTVLLDVEGRQLVNTVAPFRSGPGAPVAAAAVQKVLATQKPFVSDLITGPVTGKLLTALYAPVAAKGGRSYVIGQAFTVDHWKNKALQSKIPSDWVVAVIDSKGRFISRNVRANQMLGQPARPELVAAAAAAKDGLIRHNTLEGVESYDAFTHSALTGWTVAVAAPVSSIEGAAQRATEAALAGMLAALALAVLAAAGFGRRFIQAIEKACLAAVALGKGDVPEVEKTTIEEVNVLNHHLVEAGDMLENERRSRKVAEAERERLLVNETLARVTAEDENLAKDRFLAMLGHELRNPLAAIAGAALVLERSGELPQAQQRFLDIILRQNQHLVRIVNDLLDVSRLISGKLVLDLQLIDLGSSVASCVDALRVTQRGAAFTIVLKFVSCTVRGDAIRLEQILNNLITNAFKFSPQGSEIRVEVRQEGGRGVVTVTDQGVGMTPELTRRAFEPFFQGPSTSQYTQTGLGIGLALVEQLVKLHGGEVEASSAGLGKGSVFTFWIPCHPLSAQPLPDELTVQAG